MKVIFEMEPQEVIELQKAFVTNATESWLMMQTAMFGQMMSLWIKPMMELANESHR